MQNVLREYKSMLKPLPIEGIPDLFLFRPIAFVIVKISAHLNLNPNHLSFCALLCGLASGAFFSVGTPQSWLWGGILYGGTAVFDCSDGMLARFKKNGSPFGRIIDGTVDYANGLAIYVGLGIGLSKMGMQLPANSWLILILAAISMTLHSFLVDYYRNQFTMHALGKQRSISEEVTLFRNILDEAPVSSIRRIPIYLYLKYCQFQMKLEVKQRSYNAETYTKINTLMLKLWQVIELSLHICVLIVSAILFQPQIFLIYTIIIANIWMLILFPLQGLANKYAKRDK